MDIGHAADQAIIRHSFGHHWKLYLLTAGSLYLLVRSTTWIAAAILVALVQF
jgi:hypothetical protein